MGAEPLVAAQEAVHLRDVHPAQQFRVTGPVRAAVRRGARDPLVHGFHDVDGLLGVRLGAERGHGEERAGAL